MRRNGVKKLEGFERERLGGEGGLHFIWDERFDFWAKELVGQQRENHCVDSFDEFRILRIVGIVQAEVFEHGYESVEQSVFEVGVTEVIDEFEEAGRTENSRNSSHIYLPLTAFVTAGYIIIMPIRRPFLNFFFSFSNSSLSL